MAVRSPYIEDRLSRLEKRIERIEEIAETTFRILNNSMLRERRRTVLRSKEISLKQKEGKLRAKAKPKRQSKSKRS